MLIFIFSTLLTYEKNLWEVFLAVPVSRVVVVVYYETTNFFKPDTPLIVGHDKLVHADGVRKWWRNVFPSAETGPI